MYRLKGSGVGGNEWMLGVKSRDSQVEWGAEGWPRDMSALLTFRRRHVGWQRGGSSAEEDDKAVKWK